MFTHCLGYMDEHGHWIMTEEPPPGNLWAVYSTDVTPAYAIEGVAYFVDFYTCGIFMIGTESDLDTFYLKVSSAAKQEGDNVT